jgi:hypothetical protein
VGSGEGRRAAGTRKLSKSSNAIGPKRIDFITEIQLAIAGFDNFAVNVDMLKDDIVKLDL